MERVLFSGTTTIPLGLRTPGIPGTSVHRHAESGGRAHNIAQASCRMVLFLGHLSHGCGNVYAMGIRGTKLRQSRDLSSSALVSPLNPHRVSPRTIESIL